MTIYVAGDIRGIQDYVFGSPRLLEMRGASALVDAFDRVLIPALVAQVDGELGYSGGGNFLVRWEGSPQGKQDAARFHAQVLEAFFELTGQEGLVVATVDSTDTFERVQLEIGRRLAHSKRRPEGTRQLPSMPFLKRCDSCGRETADRRHAPGGGTEGASQWIGPVCRRKRRMHASLARAARSGSPSGARLFLRRLGRLTVQPLIPRLRRQDTPRDVRALVGDDDLAVVVADGNGLGEWFGGSADWGAYTTLSAKVDKALREALEAATDGIVELAGGSAAGPLPLQVLIAGGDDVVAALPGRLGLSFARRLVESFVVEHNGVTNGMAAGVVFTGRSFPFRAAHALAEELLARAKRRCREEGLPAALDFHRVKGSHVQSLSEEHRAVECEGPPGCGWSYGAAGPYSVAELDGLSQLAEKLRSTVSATQRGVLREILSPRDDVSSTAHPTWKIPTRVVEELRFWVGRQELPAPFTLPEAVDDKERDLLVTVRQEERDDGRRQMARIRLTDALLLTELDHPRSGAQAPFEARGD